MYNKIMLHNKTRSKLVCQLYETPGITLFRPENVALACLTHFAVHL